MLRRLCVLYGLALVLASCVTAGKLQAPKLSIVGANMVSAEVFSQEFSVRIRVDNPNARALPVRSLDYQLFLEGDSFAEGQTTAPFSVPANGSHEFDLPVRTHFVSSIGRLLSRLTGTQRTDIQYAIRGSVSLDLPFSPRIKFDESGMVKLHRR